MAKLTLDFETIERISKLTSFDNVSDELIIIHLYLTFGKDFMYRLEEIINKFNIPVCIDELENVIEKEYTVEMNIKR